MLWHTFVQELFSVFYLLFSQYGLKSLKSYNTFFSVYNAFLFYIVWQKEEEKKTEELIKIGEL